MPCWGELCSKRGHQRRQSGQAGGPSRMVSPSRNGASERWAADNYDAVSNRSSGAVSQDGEVPISESSIYDDYQKCSEQVPLGRGGGCATVELWKSLEDDSLVAVKSMDRSRSEWRNEVRMLARVCPHPNICSIKAVYLDNMYARLVLEYCAAGTLLSRVLHVNSLEPCHVSPVLRAARRSSSFGNTLLPPPASIDGPMLPPIRDSRPASPAASPSSSRSSSKSPLSLALRLLSMSTSSATPTTASERVTATPMQEAEAKKFVRDLLHALEQCHECGVVHRDVKLENIVIAEDEDGAEVARLIDFGLALRCRGKSGVVDKQIVGSIHYLAPECIRKGRYSSASDMWAAGVVLHLLLRPSVPPAAAPDNRAIMRRISTMDLEGLGSGISKEARDLRSRLLSLYPDSRLTAREALEHPWFTSTDDDDATSGTYSAQLHRSDDEASHRQLRTSSEAGVPPTSPPRRHRTDPALGIKVWPVSSPMHRPSIEFGEPTALQRPLSSADPIIIVTPVSAAAADSRQEMESKDAL